MALPQQCQISSINGQQCGNHAKGFVVCQEDSPLAVYKSGVVLCKGHGAALQEITPNSQFLTMSELADLMNTEDMKLHSSTQKDSPMSTTVQTIVPTVPVVPVASLVALAAQMNGHAVDTAPAPVVQAMPEPAPAAVVAEEKPVKVLTPDEIEEAALQEQIKALQAQLEAKKQARLEVERAKTLAVDPWSVFPQASSVRVHLMLHGGSAALAAVEVLLKAEVLSVHQGKLIVVKTDMPAMPTTEAPAAAAMPATPRPAKNGTKVQYSETMRQSVLTLKARGLTDKTIEEHLHIGTGDGKAAWSLRNRR